MDINGLLAAARNAWALTPLGGGVEPAQATPSAVLYELPHARVARVAPRDDQAGDPVLLVTPLAVPVSCWDLRPGQSLAAHLAGVAATSVGPGRPTYTIDYGPITFADRGMGFEDWVDQILPTAIRRICEAHGGAPVHLVGWSHGGTMSLLTAAHDSALPVASVTAIGTPTDYALNPAYAAVFGAHRLTGLRLTFTATALLGGTTAPFTRLGYRWLAPVRELTKPWSLLRNLDDAEVLARIGAVDRFIGAMPGYPARFFHQAIGRLVIGRELAVGTVHLSERVVVDMSELVAPTLLIGSTDDILANAASVAAGVAAYRNAEVTFAGMAGLSHLGLVASPRAHQLTWPAIDKHLAAHDAPHPRRDRALVGTPGPDSCPGRPTANVLSVNARVAE